MPTVPEGFCSSLNDANWVQTLMNLIAQGVAKFQGSGFTVVLNQSTAPGPTDRDKLWRDTDTGRIYSWGAGAWVTPHPYDASGAVRMWWEGTENDSWAFDGGDGTNPAINPPATNNGAMWEVDHNYDGRSAMGAGLIQDSSPPKNLTVSEAYGSGIFTMNDANTSGFGTHTHVYGRMNTANTNDDYLFVQGSVTGPTLSGPQILGADAIGLANPPQPLGTGVINGSPMVGPYLNVGPPMSTAGVALSAININIVHPVRGGFYLKRTQRVNFVGS